jgi:hypothetical protein
VHTPAASFSMLRLSWLGFPLLPDGLPLVNCNSCELPALSFSTLSFRLWLLLLLLVGEFDEDCDVLFDECGELDSGSLL